MTQYIIGIDEVGRGPLAGPVSLCACAIPLDFDEKVFVGIKDSKKLSSKKRDEWFTIISDLKKEGELDFSYISIEAREIDSLGIAPAIRKAVSLCLDELKLRLNLDPKHTNIMLDGSLKAPDEFLIQETIIKGDEKIPVISAASIIAKVTRDRFMESQSDIYPKYGFKKHKGYGTKEHIQAIRAHGPSPIHRISFLSNLLLDLK